jgi:hypothetical protein
LVPDLTRKRSLILNSGPGAKKKKRRYKYRIVFLQIEKKPFSSIENNQILNMSQEHEHQGLHTTEAAGAAGK